MPPPFDRRCAALEAELADLRAYPRDDLAAIVTEIGFACDGCARCCTRESNDHVFLLEDDVDRLREVAPDALVPAPDPELADRQGRLYVSGYALATTADGDCVLLENGRCRHYSARPAICRVYPYMLHREPGADGRIDWRQLAGLGEHGEYEHGVCRRRRPAGSRTRRSRTRPRSSSRRSGSTGRPRRTSRPTGSGTSRRSATTGSAPTPAARRSSSTSTTAAGSSRADSSRSEGEANPGAAGPSRRETGAGAVFRRAYSNEWQF